MAGTNNAGYGFGGHTAGCIQNPCMNGCGFPPECAGSGGVSGGMGGAGLAGTAGMAGTNNAGYGFGGHTAGCIQNHCMPGCGFHPECAGSGGVSGGMGGAGLGGMGGAGLGGMGGAGLGGMGGAELGGMGGAELGGEGGVGEPAGQAGEPAGRARLRSAASGASAAAATLTACYVLAGYEPDPCLPADASLASWFDELPAGCEPKVVTGPILEATRSERRCCYGISCSGDSLLESKAQATAYKLR
jgi:hypothetical protein